MPRKSLRRRVLDLMQAKVDKLLILYHLCEAMDEDDSSADKELITESEKLDDIKKTVLISVLSIPDRQKQV